MKGILDRCKSNIFTLILFFLIVICLVGYVQTSSADSNPYPSTQDTEDLNGDGIPDGDGFYERYCQ